MRKGRGEDRKGTDALLGGRGGLKTSGKETSDNITKL